MKLFIPEKYVRRGLVLVKNSEGNLGAVILKTELANHIKGGLIDSRVVVDRVVKEVR